MKIKKTKFKDLLIVESLVHKDKRGAFREIFKKQLFNRFKFIFNCSSTSKKRVLRGLHLQTKFQQGKYVSVLKGEIYDVAVDLRSNSKTFGKYVGLKISYKDDFSFYIPSGFAHGFVCLSKTCTIYYRTTNYRDAKSERTLAWNDKTINIKWPVNKPNISNRDKYGLPLDSFKDKFYC